MLTPGQLLDLEAMHHFFHNHLDLARVRSLAATAKDSGRFMASGSHFSTYSLAGQENFVVKILHPDLYAQDRVCLPIKRGLVRLSRLNLRVIPPLQLWEAVGTLKMVMLKGLEDPEKIAPGWLPLADFETEICAELQRKGLRINDEMQFHVWQGIPFVSDLSDIVEQT